MIREPYPAPGIPPDPENPNLPRHRPEIIAIPLARNDAQGEFVEEGQSAQTAGQQQHKSQVENSADGHWVTIDHRHVFIHESQGGPDEHAQQAAKRNLKKRKEVADIAREYNRSTAWSFDKRKDNFPAGSNKCNKFVYDVTKEAGAEATVIGLDGKRRPPLASEWADPHTIIPQWRVLRPNEAPQPGDVAAWPFHYSDASGHSGIVTSVDRNGHVRAIAAHQNVVGSDVSFNPSTHPKVRYRRYTGE